MTRPIRPNTSIPDQVDPDEHAGLLARFGINPADLAVKLGGVESSSARNRRSPGGQDRCCREFLTRATVQEREGVMRRGAPPGVALPSG
jgi:hypothetical protein